MRTPQPLHVVDCFQSWEHVHFPFPPVTVSLNLRIFQQLFRTSCYFEARFHVFFSFFWILGWHISTSSSSPWFSWDPIESWSGVFHWVPDDISRSHKQWEPRCLHKSWEKAGPELQLKQWTHSKSQDHAFVNVSWCCVFWVLIMQSQFKFRSSIFVKICLDVQMTPALALISTLCLSRTWRTIPYTAWFYPPKSLTRGRGVEMQSKLLPQNYSKQNGQTKSWEYYYIECSILVLCI